MKKNKENVLKVIIFLIIIIGIGLLLYKLIEKPSDEIIQNNDLKNRIEINMIENVVSNEIETTIEEVVEVENDVKKYTLAEYDDLEEKTGNEIIIHNGQEYSGFEFEYLNICRNTWFSLVENYEDNIEEIMSKYCSEVFGYGDAAGNMLVESNYTQYNQDGNEGDVERYIEPISIKVAAIHENTGNLENYDYNKEYTLEELTKLQYDYSKDYFSEGYFKDVPGYFEIKGVSIMNGNNSSDENWKDNARAKKIKLTINDKEQIVELEDKKEIQLIDIEYKQDTIEKPITIEVEVLEYYPGDKTNDIYISDIRCGFDTSISYGR